MTLISSVISALAMTAALSGEPAPSNIPTTATTMNVRQPESLWDSRGCIDDERGRWFRDAKFGAIIHFGVYSHLGGQYEGKSYRPSEQIIGLGDRYAKIPANEYREKVASQFNPAKFNAAEWVGLMKKAGQKYVIFTTKHHDGFCMFQTATTPYNVVESTPFKRDIVKELADECRKQGLEFCVYYSIGDWCAKNVQNAGFESYKDYMHAQLKELLTNYGDIKLLWFDNWWYVDNQWHNDTEHAKDLYTFARSIKPDMLINDRCGEGVKSDHGDYATPENQLKGSLQSRYFEVVMTNTDDDHWGWVKGATNYRKPATLIRNLIDSVSKGGNFVLNVGPTADGEFPPEHVATLTEIGRWTTANGAAIYSTIPAPEVTIENDTAVAYTTKSKDGSTIYVHVVEWPDAADKKPLRVRVKGAHIGTIEWLDPTIGDLSLASPIASQSGAATFGVSPPSKPDPYATVIKLTVQR